MANDKRMHTTEDGEQEKVLLVGVLKENEQEWMVKDSMAELEQLTETAGGETLECIMLRQRTLHAGLFIGKGKALALAEKSRGAGSGYGHF